jgi:5-methylcytosine-specific restriction endonuclease McrA
MPIGSEEAVLHMNNTLIGKVDKQTVEQHDVRLPEGLYEDNKINVWGLVPGKRNSDTWTKLNVGTFVVFLPTRFNTVVTRVIYKVKNEDLAKALWGTDRKGQTWELIFFVQVLKILNKDKKSFLTELGYSEKDVLMGNRKLTKDHLRKFEDLYGSINQFLERNEENEISGDELMEDSIKKILDTELPKKKEDRLKRLEELAQVASLNDQRDYVVVNGKRMKRKPILVLYVKARDDYKCKACGFVFNKRDGEPYVEVAHIKPLSQGGLDNPTNMVALCPNCHKKLDIGDDNARNEVLEALGKNGVSGS